MFCASKFMLISRLIVAHSFHVCVWVLAAMKYEMEDESVRPMGSVFKRLADADVRISIVVYVIWYLTKCTNAYAVVEICEHHWRMSNKRWALGKHIYWLWIKTYVDSIVFIAPNHYCQLGRKQ